MQKFKTMLVEKVSQVQRSTLARDAGWVLAGQGASFLLQLAYFVLLARMLGVEQYGIFVGATAFVTIAMPFSALGSGMLFMRHVSTNPNQFARYWGNILLSTFAANVLLVPILCLIAPHLLNSASASILLPVALANCLMAQVTQGVVQIFQTYQRLQAAACWSTAMNLLRFAATGFMMILVRHVTARDWALVSMIISAVIALSAAVTVTAQYEFPRFEPRLMFTRASEGLLFSVSSSTASVYNDIDKTMLSHYGMNIANGIYTTAYRIIDVASLSVVSVEWAASPRFFRDGKNGSLPVVRRANTILKHIIPIGALAGVAAFICAPLIPHLLGAAFAPSILALRWLCLLPVFRGVHQITGGALTGCGYQRYRTTAQIAVALLNLSLNVFWIPAYGWMGAAWASLITDCALGVLCWTLMAWVAHRAGLTELPSQAVYE
jgi:O-antigen/teichoic acid export membrane protein